MLKRLDLLLVEKKYCDSRSRAQVLIESGKVAVNEKIILKCSQKFEEDVLIKIEENAIKYVSRGGLKLEKALNEFNIDLSGKVMLDVGSSTGGFTDCALKHGAKCVIAVDVGSNQLHSSLRDDKHVLLFENTDIRDFVLPSGVEPDFLIGDLSFISLTKLIPCFVKFGSVEDFILLIKPQFECGIDIAKKHKGIIKDFFVHEQVLKNVWDSFEKEGLIVVDLTISSILGGDGNVEYLIYAKSGTENILPMTPKLKNEKILKVLTLAKELAKRRNEIV